MFKIKSHYRQKSQENLISQKNKKDFMKETFFVKENAKITEKAAENQAYKLQKIRNLSKVNSKRQFLLSRNSMDDLHSNRFKVENQISFQKELKKIKNDVKDLTINLSDISKQLNVELYKKKILNEIMDLINVQIFTQDIQGKEKTKNIDQIIPYKFIPTIIASIQKIQNEINKTKSINKNLLQQIENERKSRSIFQNHLFKIEKEICQQQNIYAALLMKSIDSKFLYLVTAANDVITNGHVVGLKKQTQEQNQKQLNRNMYMCMPTVKQIQNQSVKKSSKCIGKKGTLKKLAKILNFVQSSKALQQSQMELYHQQQCLENYSSKGKQSLSFFNLTDPNGTFRSDIKSGILCNKMRNKGHKYNSRSGKIISIKFMIDTKSHFEQNIEQIIYELFRLYQSLGINIFANNFEQTQNFNGCEDFFNFDQDQLVNQSQRRLKFIQKNSENIHKINEILENKISLTVQQIYQTQNLIQQTEKNITSKRHKEYQQKDQNFIEQEKQQNFKIIQQLQNILNLDSNNFNYEKEVQSIIEKLLQAQKQTLQLELVKRQNQFSQSLQRNISLKNVKKQTFVSTQDSQNKKKRKSYIRSTAKTEENDKKFHRLAKEKNEVSLSKASLSCRSIYQNGVKSLNNIFDNMKKLKSYERAFQREEFQKQYTNQIKKKKRVMFRRQAKVLTTLVQ